MPRKEFERVSPESVGLRSADILAYIESLEHSSTEMHGLMIMRHGKVCAEGWWAPYAPNLRHGLQSHTKTYAATAVGIAYTEGLLKLDERIIDIFPEDAPAEPSENLKLLTVRDVLCMGCGMDEMPRDSEHWIRDFLHTPVNHKPGSCFMYNSTGSTLLGAIVRQKTGLGLHDFLSDRLFRKIGIDPENLRWMRVGDGLEMGGGGLFATTEDNLRLMKLYADGGVWEGERILAEDYVRLATSFQNDSSTEEKVNPPAKDNFLGYGFQIWMCKPKGTYRADGAMGQFTIVVPDKDMIIAITETAAGAHWAQSTLDLTWAYLDHVTDEAPADEEGEDALRRKLRTLCTPAPLYNPRSSMIPAVSGKTYRVVNGILSPEMRFFMRKSDAMCADEFSFTFDNYGCIWHVKEPCGRETDIRVPTYGGRFTNLVKSPADQTQMLVTSGAWLRDDTFQVTCRWTESCLTKRLAFTFAGDGVTVEEDTNSPFKFPKRPEDEIRAQQI